MASARSAPAAAAALDLQGIVDADDDVLFGANAPLIRKLELLEEAITIVKGVPDYRTVYREAKAYNDAMFARLVGDEIKNNARARNLHANADSAMQLHLRHKFVDATARIEQVAASKKALLQNSPRFLMRMFCDFGRALVYEHVGELSVVLFAQAYLVTYDKDEHGARSNMKDLLPIATSDLLCGCLLGTSARSGSPPPANDAGAAGDDGVSGFASRVAQAPAGDPDTILDVFYMTQERVAAVVQVHLVKVDAAAWKHIRMVQPRHTNATVFADGAVPSAVVHAAATDTILVAQNSRITIVSRALEPLAAIDLTAALHLPSPPNVDQPNRITGLAQTDAYVFASTVSGCLAQIHISSSRTNVKAVLVKQYGALKTNLVVEPGVGGAPSPRSPPDAEVDRDEPAVSFSYAPTSIECMKSVGNSVVSGCGDGTVRFRSEAGNDQIFVEFAQYKEAGFLHTLHCIGGAGEQRVLATVDDKAQLTLWNTANGAVVASTSLVGIGLPYRIELDASAKQIVLLSVNQISVFSYDHTTIDEPDDESSSHDEAGSVESLISAAPPRRPRRRTFSVSE